MNTIKNTLETEAIFSDDQQHRYLLKKTWDSEKQTLTIITMYPHYDGVLNIDLTTQLIMNKVSEMHVFGSHANYDIRDKLHDKVIPLCNLGCNNYS